MQQKIAQDKTASSCHGESMHGSHQDVLPQLTRPDHWRHWPSGKTFLYWVVAVHDKKCSLVEPLCGYKSGHPTNLMEDGNGYYPGS